MSGVRIERQGRLAVVRIDKPRGNAIDEPLAEEQPAEAGRVFWCHPGLRFLPGGSGRVRCRHL